MIRQYKIGLIAEMSFVTTMQMTMLSADTEEDAIAHSPDLLGVFERIKW